MKTILILAEVFLLLAAITVLLAVGFAVKSSSDERKEFMEACHKEHSQYECALAWKTGKLSK